ncbi:MAG: ATP-dependent 6-phosphofructokinase [Planctomycetota bacterium]|nr:ATP-dependent 6-phosphofructokinase [Planctomycetota bacterium]
MNSQELQIKTLGPCRVDSPLAPLLDSRRVTIENVHETDKVLFDDTVSAACARQLPTAELPAFESAGPRRKIFFDPKKTRAAIVTCGGLCPGFNDVIRGLVMELYFRYGTTKIYGFRNGFQGFVARHGRDVVDLTPAVVSNINQEGGTFLGTSRGEQDICEIVDCLERMSINILFVIGGDGSMRGAMEIARVIEERGEKIAVIGVPKTIDNDIMYIDHSFGFQTAFSVAAESIRAAHVEAAAAPNGIGLVKLMGRHSGFIACYAALAKNDTNFVLIPEVPFKLDGEHGLFNQLHDRLIKRGHAVIVVAEGAGQDLIQQGDPQYDASGNLKLGDIGVFLKKRICEYFDHRGEEINLKYIDPSYMIRSVVANPYDSVYCTRLSHNAVHAAMSGRTQAIIGRWHGRFVHIPISLAIQERNKVDPDGDLWMSVLESTGQPIVMG